jgi:hypothetical protein
LKRLDYGRITVTAYSIPQLNADTSREARGGQRISATGLLEEKKALGRASFGLSSPEGGAIRMATDCRKLEVGVNSFREQICSSAGLDSAFQSQRVERHGQKRLEKTLAIFPV